MLTKLYLDDKLYINTMREDVAMKVDEKEAREMHRRTIVLG